MTSENQPVSGVCVYVERWKMREKFGNVLGKIVGGIRWLCGMGADYNETDNFMISSD